MIMGGCKSALWEYKGDQEDIHKNFKKSSRNVTNAALTVKIFRIEGIAPNIKHIIFVSKVKMCNCLSREIYWLISCTYHHLQ